jgi:hypothetical protein
VQYRTGIHIHDGGAQVGAAQVTADIFSHEQDPFPFFCKAGEGGERFERISKLKTIWNEYWVSMLGF